MVTNEIALENLDRIDTIDIRLAAITAEGYQRKIHGAEWHRLVHDRYRLFETLPGNFAPDVATFQVREYLSA